MPTPSRCHHIRTTPMAGCRDCASCMQRTASCRTSVAWKPAIAALIRGQVSRDRVVAVATPLHPDAPAREDLDGAQVHRLPMAMARVPRAYPGSEPMSSSPRSRIRDSHARSAISSSVSAPTSSMGRTAGSCTACSAPLVGRVPVVATAHDHSQVCATKVMLYLRAPRLLRTRLVQVHWLRLRPLRSEGGFPWQPVYTSSDRGGIATSPSGWLFRRRWPHEVRRPARPIAAQWR